MSRPGLLTYLVGNPVSALLVVFATLILVVGAFSGSVHWLVALVAVIVTGHAMGCNRRLQEYGRWKREWDGMGGQATAKKSLRALAKLLSLRILFGVGGWLLLAFLTLGAAHQPGAGILVALFWLGSAFLLGNAVYRAIRRRRAGRKATNVTVRVCLAVPRSSPSLAQANAALPDYCRLVMR